jgi:Fic family protein
MEESLAISPSRARVHEFIRESNRIDEQYDRFGELVPGSKPGELLFDNHLDAYDFACEVLTSGDEVPTAFPLDVQAILLRGVDVDTIRGNYRRGPVQIRDPITHRISHTPPPLLLKPLLEERWMPQLRLWMPPKGPPIVRYQTRRRAWWLHNIFECIHPLEDGNGRTGRIVMNAFLHHHGLRPMIVYHSQMEKYCREIQKFRGGEFNKFLSQSRLEDSFLL